MTPRAALFASSERMAERNAAGKTYRIRLGGPNLIIDKQGQILREMTVRECYAMSKKRDWKPSSPFLDDGGIAS